jgi:hypothetical protein
MAMPYTCYRIQSHGHAFLHCLSLFKNDTIQAHKPLFPIANQDLTVPNSTNVMPAPMFWLSTPSPYWAKNLVLHHWQPIFRKAVLPVNYLGAILITMGTRGIERKFKFDFDAYLPTKAGSPERNGQAGLNLDYRVKIRPMDPKNRTCPAH